MLGVSFLSEQTRPSNGGINYILRADAREIKLGNLNLGRNFPQQIPHNSCPHNSLSLSPGFAIFKASYFFNQSSKI